MELEHKLLQIPQSGISLDKRRRIRPRSILMIPRTNLGNRLSQSYHIPTSFLATLSIITTLSLELFTFIIPTLPSRF